MNWILIFELIYILIIIAVCIRIIFDTRSSTKAAAYILLVIFLPILGILIYFTVGINYRKRKLYNKNLFADELGDRVFAFIRKNRDRIIGKGLLNKYDGLADLVLNQNFSPLSDDNEVDILLNGEEKFPEVFKAIEAAHHHIHVEYYIFEPDRIGLEFIDLLIKKSEEGVKVRFIFDDFGSHPLRRQVKRMRNVGIEVYPFYEIKLFFFANRMNYRNHRKIIVIDGETGFLGGINVSDRYLNLPESQNKYFWRDTHLKLRGSIVHSLQYIFIVDWNFCSKQRLEPDRHFFPMNSQEKSGHKIGQIVASGPDSDAPFILQSFCKAISLAKEEILITNPYFIPNPTIMDLLLVTALSGVKVKLLVPGISDSRLVNIANHSHFTELLSAGVEVYTYSKGFVHAKTMVIDADLAIVGTANMDYRSFDLNFEVNALIYDEELANELRQAFYQDLKDSDKLDLETWNKRPIYLQVLDRIVRLISPLL